MYKGLTPSGTVPARKFETLPFSHFYAQKTFKMLPFPDFSPKVPKITKGTI
jgi:hypothetical protein